MRTTWMKLAAISAAAAATLGMAAPAEAQRYWHRDRGGDVATGALIGGAVGLAAGVAIASSNRDRWDRRGWRGDRWDRRGWRGDRWDRRGWRGDRFDRGWRGDRWDRGWNQGWRGDRGWRGRCVSRWVYDPYIGRRVRARVC